MSSKLELGGRVLCAAALVIACGGDDDGRGGSESGGVLTVGDAGTESDSGADSAESDSGESGSDSQGSGGSGDTGTKFDLGSGGDPPPGDACGDGNGGAGGVELSYIWIANSSQGTISKINTQTIIEEGRYTAKPAGGDPSRTSVNLNGDVAVANRNGGVAKFYANIDDCVDSNGVAGIQTSTGAGDVLGWGEDECLVWYTDFTCSSNRPAAWTRGIWNEGTCSYTDAKLWTVCDANVMLLNGETGVVEQTVVVPGSPFVYGGAADGDGNFWGLDTSQGQIFRVDAQTYALQQFPLPASGGYGITVDPDGRPWVCGGGGVSRFNLATSDWTSSGGGGIGGCMTDGADLIWHSDSSGNLLGFNTETLNVDESVQLPEYVHGVSVDFYGYVWGVGFANNNAYRADPITDVVDTYNGLTGAYTYSDMTGFALNSAGGGAPPG